MTYKNPIVNSIYKREWMQQRRAEYLVDKECCMCGSKKDLHLRWKPVDGKRINFSASPTRLAEALKETKVYCKAHWYVARRRYVREKKAAEKVRLEELRVQLEPLQKYFQ